MMILKSTSLIILQVTYLLSSVCGQVSQPVCKWNEQLGSCQSDTQGLLDLLTSTNSTFGNMMRCQLATSSQVCNNFSGNSCIWDKNSCHISASYLVDSITECFDETSSQSAMLKECSEQLYNVTQKHAWIDEDAMSPATDCSGVLTSAFQSESGSCDLLSANLNCYSFQVDKCFYFVSSDLAYKLGFSLQSRLKYLMNRTSGERVLNYPLLEQKLNIEEGNLELYDSCQQLSRQNCNSQTNMPSPSPSLYQYSPSLAYIIASAYIDASISNNNNNNNNDNKEDNNNISGSVGGGAGGLFLLIVLFCCCYCLWGRDNSYDNRNQNVNVIPPTPAGDGNNVTVGHPNQVQMTETIVHSNAQVTQNEKQGAQEQ